MHQGHSRKRVIIIPVVVFLVLVSMCGLVWYWVEKEASARLASETYLTARQVSLRLTEWVEARILLLYQFTNVVPPKRQGDSTIFEELGLESQARFKGFQAVNWVDRDHVVRVIVPSRGNEPVLGRNLLTDADAGAQEALAEAGRSLELKVSGAIRLIQGGFGFAAYLPVQNDSGELLGFVNGVFRFDDLINSCLNEEPLRKRFHFAVLDRDGTLLVSHQLSATESNLELVSEVPLQVEGQSWVLALAPSRGYGVVPSAFFGWAMFLVGVGCSLSIALLLWQSLVRHEDLRSSEEQYRSLFENSKDAICISSINGRFLNANSAALELLGYEKHQFLALRVSVIYEEHSTWEKLLAQLQKEGSVRDYEAVLRGKNGEPKTCRLNAVLAAGRDSNPIIQTVIRDITEQRELKEKFIHLQKMEAIGRLAGGIAHDFNNLLTVISGNVELALLSMRPDSPGYEQIGEIRKTAQRAADIVKQLLALGRRQFVAPRVLDLTLVFAELDSMIRRVIGMDISLEFLLEEDLYFVELDPSHFQQIIMNLAVNARDAMESGGSLQITAHNFTVEPLTQKKWPYSAEGEYVLITVADTGHGIESELADKVFEPFFTTKEEGKGTGLGLSTVFALVQQNRGAIVLNSEPGQGSVFSILFPKSELPLAEAEAKGLSTVEPSAGRGEAILVVEEEPGVRQMIVRSLESYGFKVYKVGALEEALSLLQQKFLTLDLLVAGISGPGVSGTEMFERIQQLYPDLKVLFLSGYPGENILDKDLLKGSFEFLQKPFLPSELARTVNKMLAV